jgi:hypothetical protein
MGSKPLIKFAKQTKAGAVALALFLAGVHGGGAAAKFEDPYDDAASVICLTSEGLGFLGMVGNAVWLLIRPNKDKDAKAKGGAKKRRR